MSESIRILIILVSCIEGHESGPEALLTRVLWGIQWLQRGREKPLLVGQQGPLAVFISVLEGAFELESRKWREHLLPPGTV